MYYNSLKRLTDKIINSLKLKIGYAYTDQILVSCKIRRHHKNRNKNIRNNSTANITCYYEVKCKGKLLVIGKTKHRFVNKDLKPIHFPKGIRETLEKS